MNFYKTSVMAAATSGVTMLCGLITTKYVAIKVGPAGMAYIGQFSNFVVLISLFASAAINIGVTKYLAEYRDEERRTEVISNAIFISVVCSGAVMIVVSMLSRYFSNIIFGRADYWDVIIIYAAFVFFPVINALFLFMLNGIGQVRVLSLMGIGSSILNVIVVIISATYFGIKAILLSNLVSTILSFYVYFRIVRQRSLIPPLQAIFRPAPAIIRKLFGFSIMNVVSGLLAPFIQLTIRTRLLHHYNAHDAGIWQASTRISDYYLNFIVAVMGVYYLPKLSSLQGRGAIRREIRLGYLRILPATMVMGLTIWLCRDFIIRYVLTEQFRNILPLLRWQLVGDVAKVSANLLIYYMVAKAMVKLFIGMEIFFSVLYGVVSFALIARFGIIGSVYAFCINYALYFITLIVLLRRDVFGPASSLRLQLTEKLS